MLPHRRLQPWLTPSADVNGHRHQWDGQLLLYMGANYSRVLGRMMARDLPERGWSLGVVNFLHQPVGGMVGRAVGQTHCIV